MREQEHGWQAFRKKDSMTQKAGVALNKKAITLHHLATNAGAKAILENLQELRAQGGEDVNLTLDCRKEEDTVEMARILVDHGAHFNIGYLQAAAHTGKAEVCAAWRSVCGLDESGAMRILMT